MRRIAVTSRTAIDIRNCGLGSSTIWAKRKRGELGKAGDARDTKVVELEEACFMEMTHATMNEVASRSWNSNEKSWRINGYRWKKGGKREKPCEAGRTDKSYVKARGVVEEFR